MKSIDELSGRAGQAVSATKAVSDAFEQVSTKDAFWSKVENKMEIMSKIAAAKNSDYADTINDPFLNFRTCEVLFGIPAWVGVAVRLSDKFSRQCAFERKGSLEVKDESFTDTCIDAANYALIMADLSGDSTRPLECIGELKDLYQGQDRNYRTQAQLRGNRPWQNALSAFSKGMDDLGFLVKCSKQEQFMGPEYVRNIGIELALNALLTLVLYEEDMMIQSSIPKDKSYIQNNMQNKF